MPTEKLQPGAVLQNAANGKTLEVLGVTARVLIDGPVANTRVEISFRNNLSENIEGDLVFPLSPFAALKDLRVKVGTREIVGVFKARERAQADYARAKAAGQTAALGESEGEDLVRLRVAPIAAGEDVITTVEILGFLTPIRDGHRFVLPLTYMPRFVEDPAKLKSVEQVAIDRARPATSIARATVELRVVPMTKGNPRPLRGGSHAFTVAETGTDGVSTYQMVPAELNRDLVVDVLNAQSEVPAVWARHDAAEQADVGGPATVVGLMPPPLAAEGAVMPREVIFLIDRSGSMQGDPMEAAKRAVRGCLRALAPVDRFNIISFDNVVEALAPASVEINQEMFAAAETFIDKIDARGGTNLSEALRVVLHNRQPNQSQLAEGAAPDPNMRLRIVVVLTDGDVAGAGGVIQSARDQMHDSRVFVIGIGNSVAHALLAVLAEAGRGTYIPAGTDAEGIENAVGELKSAIDAPLLTGVKVRVESGGDVYEVTKLESGGDADLFASRPLLVAFRGPIAAESFLVISGQRADGFELRIRVPLNTSLGFPGVAGSVWALLKNKRLTYRFNPEDDATLETLGVAFGLVNRRTALVGVHQEQRGLGPVETVPVVLPLPRNVAQAQGENPTVLGAGAGAIRGVSNALRAMGGQQLNSYAPSQRGSLSFRGGGSSLSASRSSFLGDLQEARDRQAERSIAKGGGMLGVSRDSLESAVREIGDFSTHGGDIGTKQSAKTFLDTAEGLRALMLLQGADGLFGNSVRVTYMAVAALARRGHTAYSGSFQGELRKTIQALEALQDLNALVQQIKKAVLRWLREESHDFSMNQSLIGEDTIEAEMAVFLSTKP